ncbi:CTP synthetase [Tsuneonella suprasediminis]|uniref:CTP synthetase n=1 Tax=Tsuneonella suprasediminis TaxID=2306996 RepID=A0A419QY31_9SPHN|nr:CTP synthetase [Tsuneonella suprasediminis]RJX65478.1 CTP synthetase [Tsuneonella suprasediminis]
MIRLALILHFIVATVLMGVAITALLVINKSDPTSLLLGALGGFVVAMPVSWAVARAITRSTAS